MVAIRRSLTRGLFFLTSVAPVAPVAAQSASFTGRVLDGSTSAPIPNATVASPTSGGTARTDSTGRFRLDGLKVGIHRFMVSADGYARGSLTLAFAAREVMERDLMLELVASVAVPDTATRAQALPTVPVTADPALGRRYADFERRRVTGRGQYITRAEIEKGNYMNLQDAMRTLRGVKFSCAGSFCTAQMTRAPMGCFPDYVVDERVDNAFGPTIPVRDIQGIEVYSGASDVPGEFAGRNAGCGVVVIWTTSGRAPRRK
jgi:hypothetical protein